MSGSQRCRGDRRQRVPVGTARCEEHADAPVAEVRHAVSDALHLLDQRVRALGRSVGDTGGVPGDDRLPPLGQGAAEPADLRRPVTVLEIC